MSAEWSALVLGRLGRSPPEVSAAEYAGISGSAWVWLVRDGVFRAAPHYRSATCDGCQTGFTAEVEFLTDRRTGERRAYLACPRCGPVEVEMPALQRWHI